MVYIYIYSWMDFVYGYVRLLQMPDEQSHDAVTSIGKYGCHAQSRTTIECAGKT